MQSSLHSEIYIYQSTSSNVVFLPCDDGNKLFCGTFDIRLHLGLRVEKVTKEKWQLENIPFLLANSSHKYIWELFVLAKYGNFVLNIQNFEKTSQTFLNEYQKRNWFLKKKVICQNSSQTVLTPAIIWELFAKKSADRPNCHYSSVTFSKLIYRGECMNSIFWVSAFSNTSSTSVNHIVRYNMSDKCRWILPLLYFQVEVFLIS